MFRWGILSTAKIGREHLVPAIMQSDNGVVSAIASRDLSRAQDFARRFNIEHSFGSYEALLESDTVDGVYIPLVTSQHVEWAIKSAQAGKHVLVEKPLALNASEIEAVIKARDEAGVLVSEAFMVTYHPQWHHVRDLVQKGSIGNLRMVQGAFSYFNKDASNMRNVPELGGGALPDIGVYPTVTARFATGKEPVAAMASVQRDPQFGTDTYSSVALRFDDFDMTFYVATQLAMRQTMAFHGDKGLIEVQTPFNAGLYDSDRVTLHNANHTEAQEIAFPGVNQYQLEVEAFARAAGGGSEEIFTLESSLANQKVIDAIFRSGETGNWEPV